MRELLLSTLRAMGAFALGRRATRKRLRVLCYHGIWLGPAPHFGDCLFMSVERFRSRMAWLRDHGYRVLTLEHALGKLRDGTVDEHDVVITIDDAWAGTGVHMLPALKSHGFPATLYVTTENVVSQQPVWHVLVNYMLDRAKAPVDVPAIAPGLQAGAPRDRLFSAIMDCLMAASAGSARNSELVRIGRVLGVDADAILASRAFHLMSPAELHAAHLDGVDLQLHTHTHRMPDFDLERIRGELLVNRQALAEITADPAKQMVHFCYPGGVYHPSMFPLLRELGIETATTTASGLVTAGDESLAMSRILDCESMSEAEFEARLSGVWMLLEEARDLLRRKGRRAGGGPTPQAA